MSKNDILQTIARYRQLGIEEQIDYKKFYLYSIITHSTAIEGSTVTEIENQLLFSIHPWVDGNGRMSRLVKNMLQWEAGMVPVKVLKEQKARYIEALNSARDNADENIFSDVMLDLHNTNLKNEIDAFTTTVGDTNVWKERRLQLSERQKLIVDMIEADGSVTIPQMSGKAAATERTIQRDLQYLQKIGVVRRTGGRKDGKWEIVRL